MNKLSLFHNGQPLLHCELGSRPIEIGREIGCDLVIDDLEIAPRHWLVMQRHGTVVAFDVSGGAHGLAVEYPLPLDREVTLARGYSLVRVHVHEPPRHVLREPRTESLVPTRMIVARLAVLHGRGGETRRHRILDAPLHIGRAADNDIVLADASVSDHHLRLEPSDTGLVLRDLGSRNGTYVNGVRVHKAVIAEGAQLRVGRTDLRVVSATTPRDGKGPTMVAESSAMLHVLGDVQRMAELPWPVLVMGESGTGKEGIALSLHESGPRRDKRFVAINAGGLPRELVESELFGHERGAFTGATSAHKGVFEQAHGGTLFLDEIGELPMDLQARLLRVLETGELRRVGSEASIRVDVRLVCATHRDLHSMIVHGQFRQDLYFRIARLVLEVPTLRSRPEDVRALCRHFLEQIACEVGAREISDQAVARLVSHRWPGNVRELRNVLCAAAANAGMCIEVGDVDTALERIGGRRLDRAHDSDALKRAVDQCSGNRAAAARLLGIPRTTLRDRLRLGSG